MSKNGSKGFTLVELSIVIVIVALMVAGVTAGNTLVKQAKIRQALTQLMNYHMVTNTFKLTYNALPGDFTKAYDLWGAAAGCTNTIATPANRTGCNGNGNRTIDWDGEEQRFWQELYLAKLIPIRYLGVQGTHRVNPLENPPDVPKYFSESGAIGLICVGNTVAGKNRFEIDGQDTIDLSVTNVATLRGATAFAIDGKIDDGRSTTGKIQSSTTDYPVGRTRNGTSVNLTCDTGGVYDINQKEPACGLMSYF